MANEDESDAASHDLTDTRETLEKARQAVLGVFDNEVDPRRMSRRIYKELIGDLIDELEMRLETAEQEDEEG